MNLGDDPVTLFNLRNPIDMEDGLDEDESGLATYTKFYDSTGKTDKMIFNKRNKISMLTELKPNEKWSYADYTNRILEAEGEMKEKKKIQVIYLE
jgi:hypothetical protein